jgi:hypothetical protein
MTGKESKSKRRKGVPVKDVDIVVDRDTYEIDGMRYARVTRVLDIIAKPEFYRWYAKHGVRKCNSIRDDRAAFGTRLHKEIQNKLEGKNVWLDNPEMVKCFKNFNLWLSLHDVEIHCLECNIWNKELLSAGTCDFVGRVDGKNMLLDWKSSKRVYDTHNLQVAAYLYMYELQFNKVLGGGAGVICVTKDGVEERYLSRDECLELVKLFRYARELFRWKFKK